MDSDMELGETSGSIARENLMLIIEYSTKLFNMIKPGDKLEGWVAMKLTTASECISSSKHYMDYVQFEQHAMDEHFEEGRRAKRKSVAESRLFEEEDPTNEELAKAQLILNAKSLSGKVQDMAEDVAKLSVNDLMPLVDSMRAQFGPEAATGFNETVKTALDELLDLTTKTKETVDNAVTTLQGGGVPAGTSDIEQAEPGFPPAGEIGSEEPAAEEPAAEEPAAEEPAAEEPALGRAKKQEVAEGKNKTKTTSGIDPDLNKLRQQLGSTKASSGRQLDEKWGTKMHTAKKDKGKWDGYTIAELKEKKAKLMKKETRTPSDQTTVKQINFAIRAKQKNKWGKIKEGSMTCNECGMGTYVEGANGKMRCDECGATMIAETRWKFDKKTAQFGIDHEDADQRHGLYINDKLVRATNTRDEAENLKNRDPKFKNADIKKLAENWPGYKKKMANQKKIMSRTDKEWNAITKIDSEPPVVEGIFSSKPKATVTRISPETPEEKKAREQKPLKPGKPVGREVTPAELAKDLERKMPAFLRRGKVDEVAHPGKEAEDFINENTEKFIESYGEDWKRRLYATAWKEVGPKSEGYDQAVAALAESKAHLTILSKEMLAHKSAFKKMLAEGTITDPLKVGYGLQGEAIRQQMIATNKKITEQKSVLRHLMQEGVMGMLQNITALNQARELAAVKQATPYGVHYDTANGRKSKKMFESVDTRAYWLELHGNKISNVRLINPETFDQAINKKIKA
jgi:hypothetical protein